MQRWDKLEDDLVEAGASARYAERLCEELADHRAALLEEQLGDGAGSEQAERAADQRLGDLARVANAALSGRAAYSLAQRRPSLVFLAAPLITACAMIVVCTAIAMGLAWVGLNVLGWREEGPLFQAYASASYSGIAFGLLPVLAFAFCAQAWLSRASTRWALVACLALALVGGLLGLGYHIASPVIPGDVLYVGFGWEPRVLRFLLPLLVFLAFRLLARSQRAMALICSLRRYAL